MSANDTAPEEATVLDWSISLHEVPAAGLSGERHADAAELARINRLIDGADGPELLELVCRHRFDLLPITGFEDRPGMRGRFEVEARLHQTCVVTLERFETRVAEEFVQDFVEGADEGRVPAMTDHEDPFADEPPLDMPGGRLVYGPLVYEYFAMGIDPNPRRSGAAFDEAEEAARDRPPSPFAVLKKLQDRD